MKRLTNIFKNIKAFFICLVMPLLLMWQRYRFQRALYAFLKDMGNRMKSNKEKNNYDKEIDQKNLYRHEAQME